MQPTIKTLNTLVREEAKNLKKLATKKERSNLSIDSLNPDHSKGCIYGQMTGECVSKRANKLIKECATRVFKAHRGVRYDITNLNGAPQYLRENSMQEVSYWSPIEIFISQSNNQMNGNNKRLIAYLKDEAKRLILK